MLNISVIIPHVYITLLHQKRIQGNDFRKTKQATNFLHDYSQDIPSYWHAWFDLATKLQLCEQPNVSFYFTKHSA